MKYYIFIAVAFLSFFGCKKDNQKIEDAYAYIGGEIINPNTNFVVLSKDEEVIDTVKLDGRNRFLYKITDLKEGMYTFRHGGEYQIVLLEPKDSVLFRLNTLDFDESLVFTGEGDKKNNYLINDFLESEKEEKQVIKLCQLNPATYQKHLDSLKDSKLKAYKEFKKKYGSTELFEKIALANINYTYYSSKEVYPFIHYGKNKAAILKSVPDDFYSYRKNINYNDTFFSRYFNYNTFLRHNVSNMSLELHDGHTNSGEFDRTSLCYNLDRLKLIDSLITNKDIKSDLLHYFTIMYLSRSENPESNDAILKSYTAKSSNEKDIKMLTKYTKSLNSLRKGSHLPDIELVNYEGEPLKINTLVNAPTSICFWSQTYYDHFRDSHKKLNELKEKYPEINFITINIDSYGLEKSKTLLLNHGFDLTDEYQFKNPKTAMDTLAIYPMTKTILIDRNKEIINSNANIFSVYFEEQLLGLINK
ncbi:hypothetical protein L3X39_05075 [Sabulilitoribacter multivorans]|uniref:Thioredoxin domain-containing protein n=1 Tax=Flaviramulus multivorans TaxID=1304750 RepID=A0ABS9IIL0_9FLAO|nr:hypothetical protein [Flaviramulus multivorans]MCF7560002.1 hypothetical protein [Flaviramulus multivorans]